MRLAVTGATGRTGGEVVAAARERGHDVLALSRSPGETVAGVETRDADDLDALLGGRGSEGRVPETPTPDVFVDFTVPEASVRHVAAAAEAGVPAVVGTTGFDEEEFAALEDAAERVPILKATNFARGIQALLGAVREAVGALPGYDVELTETHHNGKRDAPSGTAKTVLSEIGEVRETEGSHVYGREGIQPREEREVGVHVRRAGDVRGEHEVLLAGNDEMLTLTHRAESRGVFAAGALDAAAWLVGREPGWYEFGDVMSGGDSGGSSADRPSRGDSA